MTVMQEPLLPVAVGVVMDSNGRVLAGQRARDAIQGGLWEFPGGKIEAGETSYQALQRELEEETGIRVHEARPLIRIRHQYGDYAVDLRVWKVTGWTGEAVPRLGQPLCWLHWSELESYAFLDANARIVAAARLPSARYAIVPLLADMTQNALLDALDKAGSLGAGIMQLRGPEVPEATYDALALSAVDWCRQSGVTLLLNTTPERAVDLGAHGVHLNAARLMDTWQRPVGRDCLLSVACHNESEMDRARQIDADCILLGPVVPTLTHPDQHEVLGWQAFERLTCLSGVPVYALGGMQLADLETAWEAGAVGIAGIGAFQ